ncbi:MAG TPA: alpha-N-arabinofuranosidase [Planctomycetaceae bacterium]|nr:alpha-N-arabinofuranosidase [Planctomycetaceae bacterium]
MPRIKRRGFLRAAVGCGLAFSAGGFEPRAGRAQTKAAAPAELLIDPARTSADLDRRLFGSFLEHIGRAIYGGIFEPGSKLADESGFRRDVLDEIRGLEVPMVRYPGGNFVSGYNWLDGVGPRDKRPRVLERAWNSIETNAFGTNEFIAWCRKVDSEPLLAVNLGTGTPETAAALVEYCNLEQGTRWSDLRRAHGAVQPHKVKHWCLGNEMDGPWQIGHMTAGEYGRKAADAARQMRVVDRDIKLVACGSSGPFMPTYLEWDRQALEQCYNDVDAVSLHRYVNNTRDTDGKSERFIALNLSFEQQIDEVLGVCDLIRARLRSRKRLWLSFDEWNVWYREMQLDGKQQVAPHLVEEVYNLEDALLVGGILNSLIRKAARVRIGCLAQLVNVIAPLATNAERVLRQSIYFPYLWALKYARGKVLDLSVKSAGYDVPGVGPVPYIDAAATLEPEAGRLTCLILNRDLERERELSIVWRDSPPARVLACQVLTGADLKAFNTFEHPDRVSPRDLEPPRPAPRMPLVLPPRSYVLLHLSMT